MLCTICKENETYSANPVCPICRAWTMTSLRELPGYSRGYRDGVREGLGAGLLRDLLRLCHPDLHPPERRELANETTVRLLALRDGK